MEKVTTIDELNKALEVTGLTENAFHRNSNE